MTSVFLGLALGALVAGGNVWMTGWLPEDPLRLAWYLGAPVAATLATALVARATAPPAASAPGGPARAAKRAEPAPPTGSAAPAELLENAALRLLAALQEDGRLVDFLTEDIAPYSDEQVGAATRGIHETCGKALRACVTLEPVLAGREDERVTVPAGFDPAAVRLVGNVHGQPPFTGTLRHPGWRVTGVKIPERKGLDPHVIAPAEVEIA